MSIKAGISMRVVSEQRYEEQRDSISHDWLNFLIKNNIDFSLIPNYGEMVSKYLKKEKFDVLILSNGNDIIHDNLNKDNDSSLIRDVTEKLIIEYALENRIKILGVCRGAQMLNIFFGGNLIYKKTDSHVSKVFKKKIVDNFFSEYLNSTTLNTNCYHRYFIVKDKIPKELIPFAISEDGYVEGFYNIRKKILGIQWHPERDFKDNALSEKIVLQFLKNKLF
tara:strand:+ start:1461 stop:2126 length:666 start_codon:yes stop_codon:yes gene_type:complete